MWASSPGEVHPLCNISSQLIADIGILCPFLDVLCRQSIGLKEKISLGGLGPICKPKEGGGLGVHPLKQVNNALLGKWLWRVGEDSSSMWKSIMEAKYGVAGNGWDLGDQRY